ncbi:MAG: DUF6941 family protein [Phycisphaerales bacterium]
MPAPSQTSQSVRPLALLICESVLHDVDGSRTYHRLFNRIEGGPGLPACIPRIAVVVSVAAPPKAGSVVVSIESRDGADKVFEGMIDLNDAPEHVGEFDAVLILGGIAFNQHGPYIVSVHHNSETIIWRELEVVAKPKSSSPELATKSETER